MTSNNQAILLFGGTFDPIHNGHLIVARSVAELLTTGKVVLIPSAQPPHKNAHGITDAQHRLRMAELAVTGDPLFTVSDCELHRDGPSYTLDTVRHFRQEYPANVELYWLIGADTIKDLPAWYEIATLASLCTIVTAARPGFHVPDFQDLQAALTEPQITRLRQHRLLTPLIGISATDIRSRAAAGLSLRYLLPEPVRQYITTHHLYRP